MGVPDNGIHWPSTTSYHSTTSKAGKQPNKAFTPSSRQAKDGPKKKKKNDRPTLVIGSGVAESLARLHEEAKWWFAQSIGLVRIVLVFQISKAKRVILLQKWQLAPTNTFRFDASY